MVRMSRTKLDVALHETARAAYGQARGARVESITLSPEPYVRLCFPTDVSCLRLRWRLSPTAARRDTIHAVGVYLAPYALSNARVGDSDDRWQVRAWHRAWTALEPVRGQEAPLAWDTIIRCAWTDVARWGGTPDATAALEWLALQVVGRRFCSGQTWGALWHSRQARPLWSEITGEEHPTISRARIPSRRR